MDKHKICQIVSGKKCRITEKPLDSLGPVRSCTGQVWMPTRVNSCLVFPAESLDHGVQFDLTFGIST